MRKRFVFRHGVLVASLAAFVAMNSVGCSTMSNTEKGAVAGGAVGTGVGVLAGAATGNPRTGAVVGGLLGSGVGAIAGNEKDREDQRFRDVQQAQATAAATAQGQRMGLTDVIHMAQQGHDDQVIINQIRSTGSTFQLTASDLDFLKNNGVSARVMAEMQSARPAPPRVLVRESPSTVIYERGPYYYPPVPPAIIVAPRPYYYGGCYRRW